MDLIGILVKTVLIVLGVILLLLYITGIHPVAFQPLRAAASTPELQYVGGLNGNDSRIAQQQLLEKGYISIYRNCYPKGTDPKDPNPLIHITSATELQPNVIPWMPEGSKAFDKCPNLQPWMKCSYSINGHDIATPKKAHAVLFHARFIKTTRPEFISLPPYRDSQQKWIFYESEVPTNVWGGVNKSYDLWKMFNLTATVTSDSDIPLQHLHMKCQPKSNSRPSGKNYAANKSKMAAWFVSHCMTSSKREVFVDELKKFIAVDVFGGCGNETICNRKGSHNYEHKACMYDLIDHDYWFYLSFENSFCDEYVTEKFTLMVRKANVIPVVLGAADYANILPKGSFIDSRDFGSVKEMADFLIKLTKDPERYNSYIENIHAYDCRFPMKFECNLCEYLHNHRHEKQVVLDAQSFWSVEQRCVSPKDFYRTFAPEIVPNIKFLKKPDIFL